MTQIPSAPTKRYLTRSELLAKLMPTIHEMDLDGFTIRVAEMTAAAKDSFEQSLIAKNEEGEQTGQDISNVRAKLIARTLVDESGARMFTDDEADMVGNTIGAGAVDPIFRFAQKVNGFGRGVEAAAAKKSEPIPGSDSPSASA